MQNVLGPVLTVLGLITAVGGPVLVTLSSNPLVATNARLVKVLAAVGVIVTLAGVIHDALLKWQASNEAHLQTMAMLTRPGLTSKQ